VRDDSVLGPAVAGSWYPRDRDELAVLVDGLLENAAERAAIPAVAVTALIVPHAGFAYSGTVAAAAFARLRGRTIDRVVLLGPSHHFGFRGAAVPKAATACGTPLGVLPIDREAVSALSLSACFRADDRMFEREHALEAELPFLQRVLPAGVAIVPILMGGGATSDDTARVADAVSPLLRPSALLVVSSDFTHFGPRFDYVPFTRDIPARLRELDLRAIAAIEAGDAEAFSRCVVATGATICGHRAIEVLLRLPIVPGAARLLEYDTSGRMTGSFDHSVSYAAIEVTPAPGTPR
jgi:AmmeMemoRadiSam system protein B